MPGHLYEHDALPVYSPNFSVIKFFRLTVAAMSYWLDSGDYHMPETCDKYLRAH